MKVGFTGTRWGMGNRTSTFEYIIDKLGITEFRHGMCIGSDEEAHNLVALRPVLIIGHPPEDQKQMAKVKCDRYEVPKAYLVRDHDIVDNVEVMVATPQQNEEILRSGTWATIRYAKKVIKKDKGNCKRLYVLLPNGKIEFYDKTKL